MPEFPIRDNYTLLEQFDCSNLINGFLDQQWSEISDCWNPAHFGEVPRQIEASGQVSIFFDTTNEPPDPDDYQNLEAFEQAWKKWEELQNV
jgi:hypothetical protein